MIANSLAIVCMINNDKAHSLSFVRHYAGIKVAD